MSIILPTYNRAQFLPQALASIDAQTFTDWELIVVDDGSSDGTSRVIEEYRARTRNPVYYVYQENRGAYAARNTGLDRARARYVAFFDSDDVWLAHHLADCVAALEKNPDVDWVYGACRTVEFTSGRELEPSTFYVRGAPRPFLRLRARRAGDLRIIEDPAGIRCMMLHGFYCGLQNSLLRREVFAKRRFCTHFRNEAEDQLLVIRVLATGGRLAYLDRVHVVFHIHGENSSAASPNGQLEKHLSVYRAQARGYEEMRDQLQLTARERRALDQRLSREYFWNMGYVLLWQNGRREEALEMFRRGLRLWPWSIGYWKTYILAALRTSLSQRRTSVVWPDPLSGEKKCGQTNSTVTDCSCRTGRDAPDASRE